MARRLVRLTTTERRTAIRVFLVVGRRKIAWTPTLFPSHPPYAAPLITNFLSLAARRFADHTSLTSGAHAILIGWDSDSGRDGTDARRHTIRRPHAVSVLRYSMEKWRRFCLFNMNE